MCRTRHPLRGVGGFGPRASTEGQAQGRAARALYLVAGGITWRAMPSDFPVWDRVHAFGQRRRDKGWIQEPHVSA
ncbi:hypothetical protein ACFRMN_21945 [Streptomyces sp. NPDC056835]|uniref:hypothetical protein n=1 Tax=Streptomyces sp. NPDC056835 TaxID=3345956 RepID=UPI00368FBB20